MTLFEPRAATRARRCAGSCVAYDGGGFRGFAEQPDQRTVEGVLHKALRQVLHEDVELRAPGAPTRACTRGVRSSRSTRRPALEPDRLQTSLNGMLGPEIVVREADLVAPGFDAPRSSASGGATATRSSTARTPTRSSPGTRGGCAPPLDRSVLRLAADPFVGRRDFSSFCRKPTTGSGSLVRGCSTRSWTDLGDGLLRYEVRASSFCWQMVRSMVGTMVDVGVGQRRPGDSHGDPAAPGPRCGRRAGTAARPLPLGRRLRVAPPDRFRGVRAPPSRR